MRFPPSAAYRWSNCAMYLHASQGYPEPPETDPAREGTCAAWVAQVVLTGDATSAYDLVGKVHKNGWEVDEEMARHVEGYIGMIQKRGGEITCEETVTLSTDPLISGTLDLSATTKDGTLYVDDLKYGMRIVEVKKNPQLIIYGAAKLTSDIKLVQLGVYQPRAFHPHGVYRKWVVSVDELRSHANDLIEAAKRCPGVATPGPWCEHCSVAPRCTALAHTVYQVVERDEHRDMTLTEMSNELKFLDRAKAMFDARYKAVFAEAEERAKKENIPGWKMQPRYGQRKLTTDPEIFKMLTGIDPYVQKVATPAELERRGAKNIDAFSKRPMIGHELKPFDIEDMFNAQQ